MTERRLSSKRKYHLLLAKICLAKISSRVKIHDHDFFEKEKEIEKDAENMTRVIEKKRLLKRAKRWASQDKKKRDSNPNEQYLFYTREELDEENDQEVLYTQEHVDEAKEDFPQFYETLERASKRKKLDLEKQKQPNPFCDRMFVKVPLIVSTKSDESDESHECKDPHVCKKCNESDECSQINHCPDHSHSDDTE
jgi:hypothetical protein